MLPENQFNELKERFINSNLDEKVRIYTTTQGLTEAQYTELLKNFPLQHLDKLEVQ
jgi:hypothetical protein